MGPSIVHCFVFYWFFFIMGFFGFFGGLGDRRGNWLSWLVDTLYESIVFG